MDGQSGRVPVNRVYVMTKCMYDYHPESQDQLSINSDETVYVIAEGNLIIRFILDIMKVWMAGPVFCLKKDVD